MPNKAYNYEFKMLMEGVEVPFYSAVIMNTPNGVEATISMYETTKVYDLKPKTMVQIFYRDWMNFQPEKEQPPQWRVLFNGSFCKHYKHDEAKTARGVSLVCRDFRSDIRKAPSTIINTTGSILGVANYSTVGIEKNYTIRTETEDGDGGNSSTTSKRVYHGTRTFRDDMGTLADLWHVLSLIAGSTIGKPHTRELCQVKSYNTLIKQILSAKPGDDSLQYGFFLDAIARGIWTESVSGTRLGMYLNKRVRMDKMLLIPKNEAGTFMFNSQTGHDDTTGATHIGGIIMGHSRYASVESVIMNLAALFSMRPYACNTPSIIRIDGNERDLSTQIMDERVRQHLLKEVNFGAPYITNQGMLLPPLEFSAPPNCNLMFPCMYNRVEWDYDFDVDNTRARYTINNFFQNSSPASLGVESISLPLELGSSLFLTEEERYKGTNLMQNTINNSIVTTDASSSFLRTTYGAQAYSRALEVKRKLLEKLQTGDPDNARIKDRLSRVIKDIKRANVSAGKSGTSSSRRKSIAYHHAKVKFFNARYNGRVCSADMTFNPFVMSGFPGVVVAGENAFGEKEAKNIIGMVQQVKHSIQIHPGGGEAATTVVMNNARFDDEPTDMSNIGAPIYMHPTDHLAAEINGPDDFRFKNPLYKPPDGKPAYDLKRVKGNKVVDIETPKAPDGCPYIKDLATITQGMSDDAITNRAYIDTIYEPNKIARFYKDVMGVPKSFMVGRLVKEDGSTVYYMHDTVQEALHNIVSKRQDLLHDYQACMQYIYRNVINANQLLVGVLGLSRRKFGEYRNNWRPKTVDGETVPSMSEDGASVDARYYGLSTEYYNEHGQSDDMKERGIYPGGASSVREKTPITAIIKERVEAVLEYKREAERHAKAS